ncbi:hypothetical protein LTR27_004181 [Elasticomyces elasticus]|nr:hypothetical protein LTR27_004181 [Elasticomyces elasticus]
MDEEAVAQQSGLEQQQRPRKRARTAVACSRCKHRKQKCDGLTPSCSNCVASASTCEYDLNPTLNRNQEQYMRARRRVEELEGILGRLGDAQEGAGADASSSETFSPEPATSNNTLPRSPPRRLPVAGDSGSKPPECVDVLRQLSLQATGGYVDSSSTVTLGRMLHAVVATVDRPQGAAGGYLLEQNMSPKSLEVVANSTVTNGITLSGIPDVIADRMLEKGYFGYIARVWPLMQPNALKKLHKQRANLEDRFEIAALHLVYATAGRFLETTGETGSFRSELHYQTAATLLPEVLSLHDIRSVQILCLLAIYSLRAPRGPGAWSFVGMAMRMCIEMGLHRRCTNAMEFEGPNQQLKRQVFWSCYCLDRQVSIILGRPFAISDRDIDAELPTKPDDEDEQDSTPCFVHICRLRMIESRIQQTVYRADQPQTALPLLELQSFIEQLEQWKCDIPAGNHVAGSSSINTYDSYLIYYYQAVRFLLHPHVSSPDAHDQYLKKAVEACGGICQTYKRLHQNVTIGFSLMALHSVFFAGLTMLYCAWRAPLVLTNSTRNTISDCSIVLYIITERWPGAKKYRDLYEAIKDPVLQTIEQHNNQPQMAVEQLLQPDVHALLRSTWPAQGGQEDFSAMLMEMSGGVDGPLPPPQQQDYNDMGSTDNAFFVPGLAFDFSLPFESSNLAPSHAALNTHFYHWGPGVEHASGL